MGNVKCRILYVNCFFHCGVIFEAFLELCATYVFPWRNMADPCPELAPFTLHTVLYTSLSTNLRWQEQHVTHQQVSLHHWNMWLISSPCKSVCTCSWYHANTFFYFFFSGVRNSNWIAVRSIARSHTSTQTHTVKRSFCLCSRTQLV